ncbi:hypothetical protein Tco_1502437 [Tanacetum coccineum]
MLENNPWFIRNNLLIMKKWNMNVNLLKEDVVNVPVWVKLHGVIMTAFSEDGLSSIATKLGIPLMLDSYNSDMCIQSWGRLIENDINLGTNKGASNLASKETNFSRSSFWNVGSSSISTTPIVEKIDKLEKLIIDEKITLADDVGKPMKYVDYLGDHDSEDEVEPVDNEMTSFLASDRFGYGTNSLLKQWRGTYENANSDYDQYNDDMYEGREIQ